MYYKEKKFNGVYLLIIINFAVYFIVNIVLRTSIIQIFYTLGMVPVLFIKKAFLWQTFTYFFLHGSFSHIFWNMFALFMFGIPLEMLWGRKKFIIFYLLSGVLTGAVAAVIYLLLGQGAIVMIGASGAIYALLIGFALTFPDELILLFFVIPIKAKYTPVVFAIIDLLLGFNVSSNVAHFAHLTGLLIGYIVFLFMFRKNVKLGIGLKKKNSFVNNFKNRSKNITEDDKFFLQQSLYKLINNIYFSDFEIKKLQNLVIQLGDTIVACNPEEFDPENIKCLKCSYLPYCILREIKRKHLY